MASKCGRFSKTLSAARTGAREMRIGPGAYIVDETRGKDRSPKTSQSGNLTDEGRAGGNGNGLSMLISQK